MCERLPPVNIHCLCGGRPGNTNSVLKIVHIAYMIAFLNFPSTRALTFKCQWELTEWSATMTPGTCIRLRLACMILYISLGVSIYPFLLARPSGFSAALKIGKVVSLHCIALAFRVMQQQKCAGSKAAEGAAQWGEKRKLCAPNDNH